MNQWSLLTGNIKISVNYLWMQCHLFSTFNGNFGGFGGIVDFRFFSGKFNNVTFNRNTGPAVRVSLYLCESVGI